MSQKKKIILFILNIILFSSCSETNKPDFISFEGKEYQFYPVTYDEKPPFKSPYISEANPEIIIIQLKDGSYALAPVNLENGTPYCHTCNSLGKGDQLIIDKGDFPSLGTKGLHHDWNLDNKKMITGMDIGLINYIAKPGRFSGAGFIAEDEDIISVLKGDNRIVDRLGLTHPKMAIPLFHVWNIPLRKVYNHIQSVQYNGNTIYIDARGGKGYQKSIFNDEITGNWQIDIYRKLNKEESDLLKEKYSSLTDEQMDELQKGLSVIHIGEMNPYYIMRYGFYEGHTDFRANPIAIAFIFGLKSIQTIEAAFPGGLYKTVTEHFTPETVKEN